MLSDDGTDYRIAMNYAKPFHSHKFKKSALRYEVGVGIKSGDICWWWGPFEPGIWNDNMIFQSALMHELEEGERVETDAGYKASSAPEHVKCPGTVMSDLGNKENIRQSPCQARNSQQKIETIQNTQQSVSACHRGPSKSICCNCCAHSTLL